MTAVFVSLTCLLPKCSQKNSARSEWSFERKEITFTSTRGLPGIWFLGSQKQGNESCGNLSNSITLSPLQREIGIFTRSRAQNLSSRPKAFNSVSAKGDRDEQKEFNHFLRPLQCTVEIQNGAGQIFNALTSSIHLLHFSCAGIGMIVFDDRPEVAGLTFSRLLTRNIR